MHRLTVGRPAAEGPVPRTPAIDLGPGEAVAGCVRAVGREGWG